MYSFNVEQSKGDTQNLVIIAMNEMGLDVQGAVDYVGELIKARIDQYVMEKHCLPSWGAEVDAEVAAYVAGLERWVIGVLHWSFDSERYFGAEHERIKKDLIVTLLPVDLSSLPAPDSTIVEDSTPVAEPEAAASTPVAAIEKSTSPSTSSWSSLIPSCGSKHYNYITLASMLFPPLLAATLRVLSYC